MLRIMIIGSTPRLGLAFQFAHLAVWLSKHQIDMHVAGCDGEATPGLLDMLKDNHISFYDVPGLRKTGLKQMIRPDGSLTEVVQQVNPDVLITTTIGHLSEIGRMENRPATVYWLRSVRNTRFYAPAARLLAAQCANRWADQVWVQCLNEKHTMIKHGLKESLVQMVPNPIDIEWWQRHSELPLPDVFSPVAYAKQQGRIVLVYPASLLPGKRHEILFKALSIVKQKYPKVFLCCPGRFSADHLRGLVRSLNLQDNVMFTESLIEQEAIPPLLKLSDILVFTSRSETYGKTLIESFLLGLPAVTTRVGVALEAENDQVALVCDIDDYKTIAENILFLLSDENYRKTLGQKARQWVLDNYSYQALGEKMIRLLHGLCPRTS